jgi:putative endopeptidase
MKALADSFLPLHPLLDVPFRSLSPCRRDLRPPREDFYRHACGAWLRSNRIPPDLPSWTPTSHLTEVNLVVLRGICEAAAAKPGGTRAERLVGDFFAAAADERRIEELRFRPVEALLAEIERAVTRDEIAGILARLHLEGVEPLFSWFVEADERKSDVYALHLIQGGLSLPERAYYFEPDFAETRAAFTAHVERMFALAGSGAGAATRAAAEVMRIESELARASKAAEELNDSEANYHKLAVSDLSKAAPGFPWSAFLDGVGARANEVIAGQPEFLAAMARIFSSEPPDTLKILLRWQVLTTSAPLMHAAVDDEDFSFFGKVLGGQKEKRARWKRAVAMADGSLGDALGQLYAAERFPPEAKRRMDEMVALIREVFRDHIAKAGWMSEPARAKALAKLERFRAKLGFPAKWKAYEGLEIRRDDHHGNVRRAARWESRRQFARIGQPVDREEWSMTVPTVNAYFDQTKNEIVFPAGILQPPFFDPAMDDAVNYGATGATIAHELTHGFDSDGRKYDAEGNLKDWWTPEDEKEFDRRAGVLVAQFDALEGLPGVKVNGKLTLPENIADLGGIVLAVEALQRALAKDPAKRRRVDGLTPEQRFFISYSQSWAALQTEELLRQYLTADPHAPDHLRAVAPLRNFAPWYDAFGIKPGMKLWLDPAARAAIW